MDSVIAISLSKHISGHERMLVRILEEYRKPVTLISLSPVEVSSNNIRLIVTSLPRYTAIYNCIMAHVTLGSPPVLLLASGSPYGHLLTKILFAILPFLRLWEYCPFPELKIIMKRPHHHLAKIINKIVIEKRILIDFWQLPHSSVSNCVVIRNVV
jgi:hypothetical protein